MSRTFYLNSDVDPRDLAVNVRFRGKAVTHPRARAAQEQLVAEIKQAIQAEEAYDPCEDCGVVAKFMLPNRRSDHDGPLKRTLDAIEQAHKALGYTWNDNRVSKTIVERVIVKPEVVGIVLLMGERGET